MRKGGLHEARDDPARAAAGRLYDDAETDVARVLLLSEAETSRRRVALHPLRRPSLGPQMGQPGTRPLPNPLGEPTRVLVSWLSQTMSFVTCRIPTRDRPARRV